MNDAQILANHLNKVPKEVHRALETILDDREPIDRDDAVALAEWINFIPEEVNAAIQRNKTEG